jgi:signal transduction histidine kinase
MKNQTRLPKNNLRTSGSVDLAFAIVVLASYFAMFSSLQSPKIFKIIIMVALGIAYISLGIYGYAYCQKRNNLKLTFLYFLVQVVLGSTIVYLGEGLGFSAILLLPLAGHAVVMFSGYGLYLICGYIVLGYLIAVRFYSGGWGSVWPTLPTIIAGLIYIMIFTQMAMDEEISRQRAEKLYDELEEANTKLLKYANEIEELATIQERNRLAREIHDGLGHYLTTILIQLQAAEAILPSDAKKALDAIEKAKDQSKLALIDVRKSVSAFRDDLYTPEDLDTLIKMALEPCKWVEINTDYTRLGEKRNVSNIVKTTVFRIVQETVNNACKYSMAKNYLLTMDYQNADQMRIHISDDGIGSDSPHGGFGLIGLKERIELINGTIMITTSPNKGFNLEITLPYE